MRIINHGCIDIAENYELKNSGLTRICFFLLISQLYQLNEQLNIRLALSYDIKACNEFAKKFSTTTRIDKMFFSVWCSS